MTWSNERVMTKEEFFKKFGFWPTKEKYDIFEVMHYNGYRKMQNSCME